MTRVLVIGIDGFDRKVAEGFLDSMPNLKQLMNRGTMVPYSSVLPPDSPTCWASIYTGLNPARHGVVHFKDPFRKAKLGEHLDERMVGRTFWDWAGSAGKKVCILFPHMGFPPWEVNGIMLGRTTETDIREYDIKTWPPEAEHVCDLSGLQPESSFPVDIGKIAADTKKRVAREVAVAKEFLGKNEWDLGLVYFSSLDNIEHIFWMHCDPDDPDFVPGNRYQNVLRECHELYDREVFGRLLEGLPEDVFVTIVSDHGHGRRPHDVVQVNEALRAAGLLQAKAPRSRAGFASSAKKTVTRAINSSRLLGYVASRTLARFPRSLGTYNRISPVASESKAWVSDTGGGLKAYSVGGIRLNPSLLGTEREAVLAEAEAIVSGLRNREGRPIVEGVWRREELFHGPHLQKLPDLVFKLDDGWGVGWDVHRGLHGVSDAHRLHSGNHRIHSAFWLVVGATPIQGRHATSMDVGVSICSLLGVPAPPDVDGQSVFTRG